MGRGIRALVVGVALGAALSLAGCAAEEQGDVLDPGLALMNDRLPEGATPGFLDEVAATTAGPEDVPDCDLGDTFDLEYSRYQGEWGGTKIYLIATPAAESIAMLQVFGAQGCGWSPVGRTAGGSGDPISIIFVPSGTDAVDIPEGWHALSNWIAVRD